MGSYFHIMTCTILIRFKGAGAAGSSSAYNLQRYANASGVDVDITVFERESYVGGRSRTVNVFGDPEHPVEVGGSIFVSVNYNLVNATRDLGLNTTADESTAKTSSHDVAEDYVGIWDGRDGFILTIDDSLSWWSIGKLLWRYGLAPLRAQALVKKTAGQFLQMYEPPIFPFASLTDAVETLGLLRVTSLPGSLFLEGNGVSSAFAKEIIQSGTRVNYGQNLPLIHGLGTMVSMSAENAMAVKGGNWQIFDGWLKAANAHVRLNHTVSSIDQNPDGSVTLTSSITSHDQREEISSSSSTFDEVIITGPLQYSSIQLPWEQAVEGSCSKDPAPSTPFVTLYVTLFASPHKLSPKFFGLPDMHWVPGTVLTTLPEDLDLGPTRDGVGPTGLWSVSLLRKVKASSSSEEHYVYKIFSPRRPTGELITRILGLEKTIDNDYSDPTWTIGDLPKEVISWFHEKIWHPYPYLYPRDSFDEIVLAPGIWYSGGIEAFASTMETSALMGKNVAALIAKKWEDE